MFFFKTLIVPAESSLLPVAKTAPRQKLLAELTRDHNTQVKKLQKLTRPAHRPPPIPMASLDPMPSPFGGRPRNSRATSRYPSLTLLSKRTARFSLFLMNKREVLHQRGFFAVPIVARPFNPFGGRDSRFQCRSFRRTRAFEWFLCDEKKIQTLLHLNRWSNDHRRFILPPTPNTHTSINFNWLIILSVV